MPIALEVIGGSHAGKRFEVAESAPFLVGRGAGTHAQIADPHLSSSHFSLISDSGQWRIVDHQSSNGTFVNDQRVQNAELKEGDIVRAGHTSFLVQFGQPRYLTFGASWQVRQPADDRGWELVEGSGFKRAGKSCSSILFSEDKANSAWPTEEYVEQQRQIILKHVPGSQVSAMAHESLPNLGNAITLNIQFQTSAGGDSVIQRQFYIRNAEQVNILTITLLESEQAGLQPEVDRLLAAVDLKLPAPANALVR